MLEHSRQRHRNHQADQTTGLAKSREADLSNRIVAPQTAQCIEIDT